MVYGGQRVPESIFPWAVAIGRKIEFGQPISPLGGYLGSGIVVASHWVLSAAHCFVDLGGFDENRQLYLARWPDAVRVMFDKTLSSAPGAASCERAVDLIQLHPEFDPRTARHDLAMLHLKSPCTATVALHARYPDEGVQGFVYGWGERLHGGLCSESLFRAPVVIRSKATCDKQHYSAGGVSFVGDSTRMIAAGGVIGEGISAAFGTCEGDSGGGLVACTD